MARKSQEEKPPKGGWLGPPSTSKLAPIAIMDKKGKMKPVALTAKQKKKHAKFQDKMKKADKKGIWRW
jgi:hypothetical protein